MFIKFIIEFMDKEVIFILDVVLGIDFSDYKKILIVCFVNLNIKDSFIRICL